MIMIMMAIAIVKMLIALTSQPLERFIFLKKKRGPRAEGRGKPKTSDCTKILEILGNMSAAIVCYPVCDVMNFEIHLSFLIKPLIKWPNTDNKN